MNDAYIHTLIKLRLLIGFLGERAQFGWWPTAFYEASSLLFLEPVFSKTSRFAQYQGVLEAARRLHDDHLSVGSYHLFRLPEEVEQDLHTLAQTHQYGTYAEAILKSKEIALNELEAMATTTTTTTTIGPVAVGSIDDLDSTGVLGVIAHAYLSGFAQGEKTYPYLTGKA